MKSERIDQGSKVRTYGNEKVIDGVVHVWSIMDNAWVTLDYWNWINGRSKKQS